MAALVCLPLEERFDARMKLNGNMSQIPPEWGGHYTIIGWCHTFYGLIPPQKYFAAHPEWFSVAYAINASTHVVGVAQIGTDITAFLYNGATMIDLNTRLSGAAGWRLIGALAINENGVMAAQASFNNGPRHAVLLLPASRVGDIVPSLCPPPVLG